jgi:hypothetical protein
MLLLLLIAELMVIPGVAVFIPSFEGVVDWVGRVFVFVKLLWLLVLLLLVAAVVDAGMDESDEDDEEWVGGKGPA